MPNVEKNEPKEHWISRCMSSEESRSTFPDTDQRYAFCINRWEDNKEKKDE